MPFERKNFIRSDKTQLHVLIDIRTTEGATHTREKHCVDCGTYINSVPRKIFNAIEATRSSSNRNEELADRVSRDTTITKQQECCWNKSHVCQMEILSGQWWLNFSWISLTVQPRHQLHLFRFFREQPMLLKDNQTLNLRVIQLQMKVFVQL